MYTTIAKELFINGDPRDPKQGTDKKFAQERLGAWFEHETQLCTSEAVAVMKL